MGFYGVLWGLPSGVIKHSNGQWTIEISDIPNEPSIHTRFSIGLFDYQRVSEYHKSCLWGFLLPCKKCASTCRQTNIFMGFLNQ